MTDQMTRWERVRATLKGGEIDRPPVSVWRHFYRQENSIQGLADAMLGFQNRFGWDFMKVNPRASYHAEDWGLKMGFSDNDTRAPELLDWPVKSARDWETIRPLDITRGVLGEQLEALGLIAKKLNEEVPFIMTVFTPLSIAGRLAGSDDAMKAFIKEHPAQVHQALDAITHTFSDFATKCLNIGASGIFYATTTWGTYDSLTGDEYEEFGRPYDIRLLQALPEAEFNVLHVCRSNNMLASLSEYPVAAFNWDTQDDTNVGLIEGAKLTNKPVIGGVSHRTLLRTGSPEDVVAEAMKAANVMEGTRWMLCSGCTIPPDVPEANLQALRAAF